MESSTFFSYVDTVNLAGSQGTKDVAGTAEGTVSIL